MPSSRFILQPRPTATRASRLQRAKSSTCHGLSSPWVWDGPYAPRAAQRVTLRPAIRGRPDMGWKAHATWHGLSSPWVWDGPARPPILPPLALFRGQPAVRPVCKIFLPLKFSYLYGSDVGGRKIGWVRKFSGPNRSRALCSPPSAGSVPLPQLQRSVFNRRAGASVRQSPPCPSSVVL